MTIEEIEAMDVNVLTVQQVADFLGKDPQTIRDQASVNPQVLGFPISQAGHTWCIPRLGFINWVCGKIPYIACYSEMTEDGITVFIPRMK